ncbi:MAG: amino acid adenylation domain-containing protein [Actinobacteria bacterium]|nr:amino acid adenylation domain-containing protein [Actinomycetota bacterium]
MVTGQDLAEARRELVRRRLAGRREPPPAAIPAADRAGSLPLSYGQERLWFLSQLTPESTEYQVPVVLRLRGRLDRGAVTAAGRQVIGRHEILRTRYQLADARPGQVIDPSPEVAVQLSDLSGVPGDKRWHTAVEMARQDVSTPFDLALGHPIRIRLIRLSDDDHLLVVTLHHIAADGASLRIFLSEFFECYRAAAAGERPSLLPLPLQYADYAVWQRERLSNDVLGRHLGYWREQLAGLTPLELPADRSRGAVRDWAGGRVELTVPAALTGQLRELAQQQHTTLFVVALSAFQLLLARYTGRRDVAVGSALTSRVAPGVQGLIGFFLDTIVLRARWRGDPSFLDLLGGNRETVLSGISHREAPLQLLVDELDADRDLSRTPLFQVMFDLVEAWPETAQLAGLAAEQVPLLGAIAKHDLRLELAEAPDGSLRGSLEYATALFDRSTVVRLAGHLLRLLESIAAGPGRPLSELAMLDGGERHRLLTERNGVPARWPWKPVADAVADWAAKTPLAPAVVAGPAQLSYAELDARASQVARLLQRRGLGRGSVAAVCLERGADLLPIVLGVWRAGAAYVPLDPADPPERLGYILRDAAARVLITSTGYQDRFPAGTGTEVVLADTERGLSDAEPAGSPGLAAGPDDLAYLIYTSGSTGVPKGVLVTHGGLLNYLCWAAQAYQVPGGAGAPLFTSTAFDLAVTALYVPLLAGQPVHLAPPGLDLADLGSWLAGAAGGRYSFVKLTPSHLELLCQQLTSEQAAGLATHLVVGGEEFPRSLADRWRALAGPDGPQPVNEYGPTEACVASVAYFPADDQPGPPDQAAPGRLPVGWPIPNTKAYLLDADLQPVPAGVAGELYLGGGQLARGYHGRPGLTAERFVPDPYGAPGARMYRTGDLARRHPGGAIEFVGRSDDQVKLRGYRIEPGEAAAVLRRHPAVRDAAVTLRETARGGRELVAYLVPGPDGGPGQQELRSFAAQTLPGYLIPAAFVTVPAIPLTANGKTDFRALPDPRRTAAEPGRRSVPPATALARQLAAAFQQVLGGEVAADDDFFDLGGDSVSAVAVVGALRDDGLDVSVQDVFEHSTVAGLAEAIAGPPVATARPRRVAPFELISAADRASLPAGLVDAYPVSMVQRGMLYEMLGDTGAGFYHNATTYPIPDDAPVSLPAMQAAAALLVERQEMLRTGFDLASFSVPMQLVHATAELPVGSQDLRELPASERDRAVRDYMASERHTPFDIGRPPLLRLFAHVTSDRGWQLTITECHPILEGWGYHLLLMDFLTWYRLIRDGKPVPPHEPLPVRYADAIAAEQQSLASGADRGYWQDIVESVPRLSLPAAWAGEPGPPCRCEVMFVDLADRLRALGKAAGVPFKSVMHAAHLKVMSMLTEEPEFFDGLVCDTRPEVRGADRLQGLFLNTVPFPFRLTAGSWRELVRDVFAQETELWPHRRFPVLAAGPQLAAGNGGRLISVLFNFLDFHSVDEEVMDFAAGVDHSEVEFSLATTAFAQGLLALRFHPGAISQSHGERLAVMYRRVLQAMAADPDGDARASYLPADEHRQLVTRWNDTAVSYPPATLPDVFEQQVLAAPDAVAVVASAGERVSYDELNQRANRLAHHLRAIGVRPETVAGICLDNSLELLIALLGVAKAGGAYLPMDPGQPQARLAFMLSETGATVVITRERLRDRLPAAAAAVVCLDRDWPELAELASRPPGNPPRSAGPDNLAYVMYTSGSTGRPKGVQIPHRGLVNYLRWAADCYRVREGTVGAPFLGSAAADLSVTNYLLPLSAGKAVRLLPAGDETQSLADVLRGGEDLSLVKLTPAHLDLLACYLADDAPPASLPALVVGGDRLTARAVAGWRRLAPGARIVNEYGPTEAVVGCVVFDVPAGFAGTGTVPVGKPIANTRAYVLDRNLQPVPVGVVGELYLAGAGLARGYRNDPAKTAACFLPDPFSPVPGARCYRTGDLARYRPDGTLEFLGRADDQIKFLGYRIEPAEIEARLRAHPGVADALVAAWEEPAGSSRLVAYVVARDDSAPSIGELREFLARDLPGYMLPTACVPLPGLPRNRAGKLDRRALPRPQGAATPAGRRYVPPGSDLERMIAGIWEGVLGADRVGAEDQFLELGGHSLAAMRVAALLRARHGVHVSPRDVLTHGTVSSLAAVVSGRPGGDGAEMAGRSPADGQLSGGDGSLVWFRRSGTRPPLFCVHDAATLRFGELAGTLGAGWPVAATQHPAMIDPGRAGMTVADLARLYAADLRSAAPGGEYHLLGWCAGVPVLWELTRQLIEDGGRVVVCLLNPNLGEPAADGSPSVLARLTQCEQLIGQLQAGPGNSDEARLRRQILELLRGLFPEAVQEREVGAGDVDEGWPEVVRSWREREQARLRYRLQPLPCPVHLIASDEAVAQPRFFSGATTFDGYVAAWRGLAGGGLQTHRVPGWHDKMLRAPLVGQLARVLTDILGDPQQAGDRQDRP